MTIDERIERLTERHEALAQSVELLVLQVRSTGDQVIALASRIDMLVTVAENHERRLNNLENRQ